ENSEQKSNFVDKKHEKHLTNSEAPNKENEQESRSKSLAKVECSSVNTCKFDEGTEQENGSVNNINEQNGPSGKGVKTNKLENNFKQFSFLCNSRQKKRERDIDFD